ncbi:MAG: hypothetical protein ACM3MD_10335 [Betaproteobacteria bacterium]
MQERRDNRQEVKRHPVTGQRDCSLGVISFKNLEWTDHLAKIVDYSVIGIGIESDQPLQPGIIWFKECVYGQKYGVLVWCKQIGPRYRAGIQFGTLSRAEEDYLRQQVGQVQPHKPVQDPEQIIAKLIDGVRKE